MKNLTKFTLCLSKVTEILCWIGAGAAGLTAIFSLVMKDWLEGFMAHSMTLPEYAAGSLNLVLVNGYPSAASVTFSALLGVVLASLGAMIFRNVYLILKTAQGETKFSKGKTPFQKDVTRMLREIGIFLISISGVELLWNVGMRFLLGVDNVELGVELDSVVIGLMVICLSQFFDYGTQLQQDVDGLL